MLACFFRFRSRRPGIYCFEFVLLKLIDRVSFALACLYFLVCCSIFNDLSALRIPPVRGGFFATACILYHFLYPLSTLFFSFFKVFSDFLLLFSRPFNNFLDLEERNLLVFLCRLNDGHDVTVHLDTAIISETTGYFFACFCTFANLALTYYSKMAHQNHG